jgi:hypothetical protein
MRLLSRPDFDIRPSMSTVHAHLNRPIHLARRDAFYERGLELLYLPLQEMDTTMRIRHLHQVMKVLETARKHAFFASRSPNLFARELDFLHFLELIYDNVKSMHSMMEHQAHLEAAESFLCQFLNTSREQCQLPAMHYRRRAEDLMGGLWQLLRLSHAPYRSLQKSFTETANENEQKRYTKAFASFRDESINRYPVPVK